MNENSKRKTREGTADKMTQGDLLLNRKPALFVTASPGVQVSMRGLSIKPLHKHYQIA